MIGAHLRVATGALWVPRNVEVARLLLLEQEHADVLGGREVGKTLRPTAPLTPDRRERCKYRMRLRGDGCNVVGAETQA